MAAVSKQRWSHRDYTVACICPMGVELAPVEAMLDDVHPSLPIQRDFNTYKLGSMAGHNLVIAVLPEIGTNAAATVATQLLNDFPAIRFGLLVGIGGGVPDEDDDEGNDIRLGDVVVSKPTATFGGVIQYDLGKYSTTGGFERTGTLDKPPLLLRSMVERLAADHRMKGSKVTDYLSTMLQKYPAMKEEYSHPGISSDILFHANYAHTSGKSCRNCDRRYVVDREDRRSTHPKFHYGNIGSANAVVKDAATREQLRKQFDILCVEMEAAGLMDSFPCLVIRGICDYADSHKNKKWQPYAAAVAAAYMKELLSVTPPKDTVVTSPATDVAQISKYDRGLNLFDAPDIGSDELFIGREDELVKMRSCLKPGSKSSNRNMLVLGGIGGIGKTQLAIAYAKRYRTAYSSVFWLNAASETTLKDSFQLLAKRTILASSKDPASADDDQLRHLVLNWFSELGNTGWLLIFDNYDDPHQYRISGYYPYAYHGDIILTTRLPDKVGMNCLSVQSLSDIDQSLKILQTRSKRDNVSEDLHARRLAARLAGLPLALATAGVFLSKDKCSWTFEEYLIEYEKRWNLDPREHLQLYEYQDRTLYTTWNLSYEHLQQRYPDAARMLRLLAYFDYQAVWYSLLNAGRHDNLPAWLLAVTTDVVDFDAVMRILIDYGFVSVSSGTQIYSMHVCVHDWALSGLNAQIESWSYWYAIHCVAKSINPFPSATLRHSQFARYVPHALRLNHHMFEYVANQMEKNKYVEAADNIGLLLHAQDQLTAAGLVFQRTLLWKEKALGKDHTQTLRSVKNLGSLYLDQGKLDMAEAMFKRALAGYETSLGQDDILTLEVLGILGFLYYRQRKLDIAQEACIRALSGTEKILGCDHISTFYAVNRLGVIYNAQGKLDVAEAMMKRALAGFQKIRGKDHILTMGALGNLGLLYRDQGKLKRAEEIYAQVLAGKEKVLGSSHVSTLSAMQCLADLYHDQGKLKEAEETYMRLVSTCQIDPVQSGWRNSITAVAAVLLRGIKASIGKQNAKTKLRCLILLVEKCGRKEASLVKCLNKALVSFADDENSQIALVQISKLEDSTAPEFHGIVCDGCEACIKLAQGRHICRVCEDIDLCDTCMSMRTSDNSILPACREHDFFNAGAAFLELLQSSKRQTDMDAWMNRLKERYSLNSQTGITIR